jgi:hypothetical protein
MTARIPQGTGDGNGFELRDAVQFVGRRRVVTTRDVRDGLTLTYAEADRVLNDLFGLGLVGADRGGGRVVLFTPVAETSVTAPPGARGGTPEPVEPGTFRPDH